MVYLTNYEALNGALKSRTENIAYEMPNLANAAALLFEYTLRCNPIIIQIGRENKFSAEIWLWWVAEDVDPYG